MPKLTDKNLKEFLEEIWELMYPDYHDDEVYEKNALKSAKKILKKWGIEIEK